MYLVFLGHRYMCMCTTLLLLRGVLELAWESPLPTPPSSGFSQGSSQSPLGQKETLGISLPSQPLSLIKMTSLADLRLLPGPLHTKMGDSVTAKTSVFGHRGAPELERCLARRRPLEIPLQNK